MAAAKSRARFPYNARDREGGGTYAQAANGRELLFTGQAADKARAAAKAQAAVAPARQDDFDAYAYQMAADAADPFVLPRSARGGARDMAPPDAAPEDKATQTVALDRKVNAPRPAAMPTLAESVENRAYIEGDAPAEAEAPGAAWDSVYTDPAEAEAERRRRAARLNARVRHADDVNFYDPEKTTPVL